MIRSCNPSLSGLRQKNYKFETSMDYVARPYLKKIKELDQGEGK